MGTDLLALLDSFGSRTTKTSSDYVRAPMNYPGGKATAFEKILPHLPVNRAYIEPFGGGGSVLLARKKSQIEVYNDRHSGVVAFYRCLRDKTKCGELIERLKLTVWSREEFCWAKENWDAPGLDDVERAARWFYTIRYSFNGLGRGFGRSTKSAVNMAGSYQSAVQSLMPLCYRLERVLIENLDFRDVIKDFDSEDAVFYLDPPYYGVSAGSYAHELTDSEHAELLHRIFQMKGFVAISGYPNQLYDDPQWKWTDRISWTQRSTAHGNVFNEGNNKDGEVVHARDAEEVLWIKSN